MHRTIEITVAPTQTDRLCRELEQVEHVIGLSLQRGASIKPPGDVIIVHTLNRGVDDILRRVSAAQKGGSISVATAELASIIDPDHQDAVDNDVDEAIWEEMETGLRHQGRVTPNFVALMALGGAITTAGLVSDPVPQAIAFVAASIIAPGFEPIAKIPLGLILRRWNVVWRGVQSTVVGYVVLILAAALTFLVLQALGASTVAAFVENPEVERIAHPTAIDLLVSACAAVAGVIMIAAYRRSVIAGPLIALVLIPAAAMIGVALAAGETTLAREGLERLGLDAVLIVLLGASVLFLKQVTVHRRRSMV